MQIKKLNIKCFLWQNKVFELRKFNKKLTMREIIGIFSAKYAENNYVYISTIGLAKV